MPDNINLTSIGKASYPELRTPVHFHEDPVRAAAELVADGSIEAGSATGTQLDQVSELLPRGMAVFVPQLHLHGFEARLALIDAINVRGFCAVPHIAARRVPSLDALREFLSSAVAKGTSRVLLIGGDSAEVEGPFADSVELLRTGVLKESGISEVGFAGYPEGHPKVTAKTMAASLREKLSLASEQGLGAHVITQFSFMPERIVEYCATLAHSHPGLPVFVGLAGPASLQRLVHYARYCGVAASLSAVRKVGVKVAQLVDHRRPDAQLGRLASYVAAHANVNVVGVHLFSFGGFLETAQWMHRKLVISD